MQILDGESKITTTTVKLKEQAIREEGWINYIVAY
jgi:hypothetical protein